MNLADIKYHKTHDVREIWCVLPTTDRDEPILVTFKNGKLATVSNILGADGSDYRFGGEEAKAIYEALDLAFSFARAFEEEYAHAAQPN